MNALGRHLLLELFDCDPDAITNLEAVKSALVEAAKRAQATTATLWGLPRAFMVRDTV